ncbi:MAG TPA: hypothetical protein VMI54_30520 [Polyangiaceae bacterium]|nr:hypothetical protein [Polyangiaceae bacterium]
MSLTFQAFSGLNLVLELRRRWERLGKTTAERAALLLTAGLVGLGLLLRARGYLFESSAFWLDECSWAMRIVDRPLVQSLIRPIGFLAVSKLLAVTVSNTEVVLRALPWAAGVAATLVAPVLARELFRTLAARVLFVAVIALSPLAIDFSKEFKPYSVSLALHMGLLLFTLRYATRERGADLARALAVAAVGSVFAQDLVLAFPGVFCVLAFTAKQRSRGELAATAGVALVIIAGLALQYVLMWRHLPADHTEFWGNKYNVFHSSHDPEGYVGWSLERFEEMVAMPGIRRRQWSADWLSPLAREFLRGLDEFAWAGLFAAGLAVLAWQRRAREGVLLVLPFVLLWSFNRAGFWPLGAFRTNVFTVVYSGALAAAAFDARPRANATWRELVPVSVLVVLPLVLFERSWHEHKRTFTYDSTFPQALAWLASKDPISPAAPPELVVLDRRSCDPFRYYTRYSPRVSRRVLAAIARKYVVKCSTDDKLLPRDLLAEGTVGRRFTVLHVTRPFDKMMRRGRFGNLRVVQRQDVGSHTVVALMPGATEPKPPNKTAFDDAETDDEDD